MLFLPENLPAVPVLKAEGAEVSEYKLAQGDAVSAAGEKVLRVLFLNIMPQKLVTELDISRALAHASRSVQLLPMKIAGQTYKTTPMEHMVAFYKDFEDFEDGHYDGLIITGAPIEHLPFEQVRYWDQLCHIMAWAKTHVTSTLYICWGAQAGLYYHYGVPKYQLDAKLFGIYPQQVLAEDLPLLDGMRPVFPMPNSRHTEVRRADFPTDRSLRIVAEGEVSGVAVAISHAGREVYITGHLEYEPNTLHNEYMRDLNKGLPIGKPKFYYVDDCPEKGVDYSWEQSAWHFYDNWLKYYCL